MFDIISIEDSCEKISGVKNIFLIQPEHVASESPYNTISVAAAPTLIEGKSMYPISFEKGSGRYIEKKDITNRAGDFYNQTLSFTAKQTRLNTEVFSMLLINRKAHALIIYRSGRIRYIKNLRCLDESDSGDKNARSEHRFIFSTQATRPAPTIGGTLPNTGQNGFTSYSVTEAEFEALRAGDNLKKGIYFITDTDPEQVWFSGGGSDTVNITFGPLRYVKVSNLSSDTIILQGISVTNTEQRKRMRFYRGNVEIFIDDDFTILSNDVIQFSIPYDNETFRAFY